MKSIMFRGKRLDNGEWIVGYPISFGGYWYIIKRNTGFITIRNGEEIIGSAYFMEVDEETIEEFHL